MTTFQVYSSINMTMFESVEAERMDITVNGDLFFRNGNDCVRAFAAGQWSEALAVELGTDLIGEFVSYSGYDPLKAAPAAGADLTSEDYDAAFGKSDT